MPDLLKKEGLEALRSELNSLGQLSETSWRDLSTRCEALLLPTRGTAILPGRQRIGFGFVVSGLVSLQYGSSSGGKVIVKSFCPERSFCGNGPGGDKGWDAEIVAVEPSRLLCVGSETFDGLLAQSSELSGLAIAFAARLTERKLRRERSLLILDASGRFDEFLEEFGPLALRIPQKLVAAYLGLTPEALSRLRARRIEERAPMRGKGKPGSSTAS